VAIRVLVGAACLAAYLIWSPSLVNQHWDSLEYAHSCELNAPMKLWGNHPLGHLVLCGAFKTARAVGYQGRALTVLKCLNALFGALAVVAFIGLVSRITTSGVRLLGWTVAFGGTYGMWRLSGTADIYALAALAFLIAWIAVLNVVIRRDEPPLADYRPASVLAGALIGVALVAHQFAGPVLAAGMIGLLSAAAFFGSYALVTRFALLGLIASVAAVNLYFGLGYLATGTASPRTIVQWMIGYGADPLYGRYFNPTGLVTALASSTETLIRTSWVPGLFVLRILVPAAMAAIAVAGVVLSRRLQPAARVLVAASACQLVIGWIVVAWWEPYHIGKFWLLILPAFVALVAAGVEALSALVDPHGAAPGRRRLLHVVPLIFAAVVVYLNFEGIRREHGVNASFERTLALWIDHSRPDDVLIESDELTAHLLFWGQRPNTVNLYRALESGHQQGDPFAVLKTTMDDALAGGRSVILAPELGRYYTDERLAIVGTTRDAVQAFFKQYRWGSPVFQYESRSGDLKSAYRVLK
jgi:uncharacterized membrane protein